MPSAAPISARTGKRSLPLVGQAPALRSLPVVASPGHAIRPRSVRLSITDRCDFACTYCRPSKSEAYAKDRLELDAFTTIVEGLMDAGVVRFRLTGGEPLIHPRIVDMVERIVRAAVGRGKCREAIDLALTTNASQLEALAEPLREAGLARINVSIDSLDPERFARITRGGDLDAVLRGIEAARRAGLAPIKLNAVILRGVNDDELEAITRFAWERDLVPRFLEVMPIAEGHRLVGDHLVTVAEMRARLAPLLVEEKAEPEPDRGPARYVRARHDPTKRVGFISGTSDTFCSTCDRLRVSATGVLRPCLATDAGVDASAAAREGSPDAVRDLVAVAWEMKPDGRVFKGCTEESASRVSMRAIGG